MRMRDNMCRCPDYAREFGEPDTWRAGHVGWAYFGIRLLHMAKQKASGVHGNCREIKMVCIIEFPERKIVDMLLNLPLEILVLLDYLSILHCSL